MGYSRSDPRDTLPEHGSNAAVATSNAGSKPRASWSWPPWSSSPATSKPGQSFSTCETGRAPPRNPDERGPLPGRVRMAALPLVSAGRIRAASLDVHRPEHQVLAGHPVIPRSPFGSGFWRILFLSETAKLLIILADPFTQHFKDWYLEFWKYSPYSFKVFFWLNYPGPVPYSMLWYVFNSFTRFGLGAVFGILYPLDLAVMVVLSRVHSQYYSIYLIYTSTYFLLNDPPDYLIYLFLLFARRKWFFLPLALATKLPLIPPVLDRATWNFILYSPISLHDPENFVRYGLMITVGVVSTVGFLHDHRHIHVNIKYLQPLRRFKCRNENTVSATRDRDRSRARRDGSVVHIVRLNRARGIHQRAGVGGHHPTDLRRHHTLRRSEPLPQGRKVSSDLCRQSLDKDPQSLLRPSSATLPEVEPGAARK